MADIPFDPSGAVVFDLSSGRLSLEHASMRVLAPVGELSQLCQAAGEPATRQFGRAIGASMGQRINKHLAPNKDFHDVSMERFVEHLRGEFALVGLGVVRLEQWGRALLFVVDHANVPSLLVASAIEGAIEESTGRAAVCASLEESENTFRFLVTSEEVEKRVSNWVAEGVSWAEVMARLHLPTETKSGGEA